MKFFVLAGQTFEFGELKLSFRLALLLLLLQREELLLDDEVVGQEFCIEVPLPEKGCGGGQESESDESCFHFGGGEESHKWACRNCRGHRFGTDGGAEEHGCGDAF